LIHGNLRLHALVPREGCALKVTVSLWPSSCKRNVRERGDWRQQSSYVDREVRDLSRE
jgi:hypothetical protein